MIIKWINYILQHFLATTIKRTSQLLSKAMVRYGPVLQHNINASFQQKPS